MHAPIKILSNSIDMTRINERSKLLESSQSFEDNFSHAQAQTFKSDSNVNKLSNSSQRFTGTNSDVYIDEDENVLQENAESNLTSSYEASVVSGNQYFEKSSHEAVKQHLHSKEVLNENYDRTPPSVFLNGNDGSQLISNQNVLLSSPTMQDSGVQSTIEADERQASDFAIFQALHLMDRSSKSLDLPSLEKNVAFDMLSPFGLGHFSSDQGENNGRYLNNLVMNGSVVPNSTFPNFLGVSDFKRETINPKISLVSPGRQNGISIDPIIFPLKTKLNSSVSTSFYSIIQFNDHGVVIYDLDGMLQRIKAGKGGSFLQSNKNSIQVFDPIRIHLSAENKLQLEQKMGNITNSEHESFSGDGLRHDIQSKPSAISDLIARNQNDNTFDRSVSVDAPRTHKLDMSLDTWQKVFNSKISNAALENLTKLQFSINPQKLGRIFVNLQIDAGNVNVSIISSNGHVANILQTSEGKLETLLSDHGMKLASFDVNSEQNGRGKRDRAQANGENSGMVDKSGSKSAIGMPSEVEATAASIHNGDYDYLV
jgi:hypothetical protein